MNSWPSRAASIARKSAPGAAARESFVIEVKARSGGAPPTSVARRRGGAGPSLRLGHQSAGPRRRATRRWALRLRGLAASSSGPAVTALRVTSSSVG